MEILHSRMASCITLAASRGGLANLHTKKTLRIINVQYRLPVKIISQARVSGTPARPLIKSLWHVAPSGWMWLGKVVQVPNAIYPAALYWLCEVNVLKHALILNCIYSWCGQKCELCPCSSVTAAHTDLVRCLVLNYIFFFYLQCSTFCKTSKTCSFWSSVQKLHLNFQAHQEYTNKANHTDYFFLNAYCSVWNVQ